MSAKIKSLIRLMSLLPGLGPTSARRLVLHLIANSRNSMFQIVKLMNEVAHSVVECYDCKNLDTVSPCHICVDPKRDKKTLCIVEGISDIWAMERSAVYTGLYHVLGGLLSSGNGITPEKLGIDKLVKRVAESNFSEVIIATSSGMAGQITAGYIAKELRRTLDIKITKLACGMPVGGEIDFLDDCTLSAALSFRNSIDDEKN